MKKYKAPNAPFFRILDSKCIALREEGEDGPCIAIHAETPSGNRLTIRPSWPDTDTGATERDKVFKSLEMKDIHKYIPIFDSL